jgi:hypothetical protein
LATVSDAAESTRGLTIQAEGGVAGENDSGHAGENDSGRAGENDSGHAGDGADLASPTSDDNDLPPMVCNSLLFVMLYS